MVSFNNLNPNLQSRLPQMGQSKKTTAETAETATVQATETTSTQGVANISSKEEEDLGRLIIGVLKNGGSVNLFGEPVLSGTYCPGFRGFSLHTKSTTYEFNNLFYN